VGMKFNSIDGKIGSNVGYQTRKVVDRSPPGGFASRSPFRRSLLTTLLQAFVSEVTPLAT